MNRAIPIERDALIVVPECYSESKKGAFFEKICADILKKQSYEISNFEIRKTGMEIDILAKHTPSGKSVYVECKFYNSKKIDAGVVDLCFAQATRAKIDRIALFSTAKLGKDAQGAYETYRDMEGCDYSFYGLEEILNALIVSGKVQEYEESLIAANITHATLLIHPELPFTWIFQEMKDGVTDCLLVSSGNIEIDCDRIREILDTQNAFENIPIIPLTSKGTESKKILLQSSREVVSGIIVADDIMDPKPCKPSDFVGRDVVQKEMWDYFDAVKNNNTDTRILSIIGSSGNGKSSLVAFLSERFKNKKWKNKFYLYPVDVRSARGARFVAEAVVKAFESAIHDGFIEFHGKFQVENIEDITSGSGFIECSEYLQKNEKVLVIFFDQFEEVFMKEELFGLFRAFERFAIDVSSERENFVVGFSWRSGITLGEENPAYSMWSKLKDRRIDKRIDAFDVSDSSKLISSFEKSVGIRLNKSLRTRVIQQSQGLPWLLKKLCIHIFKKITEKVSQEELLITQLQIKSLFDEDLERPDKEVACLRYVASNSPIDHYQATKEFGQQTVYNLISDRLFIKTGEKVSVYWDVFRDYLITNEAPVIPWSYMPAASVNMAVTTLRKLNENCDYTFDDLLGISGYKKGTLVNILMDLQSLSLIKKHPSGKYERMQSGNKPEDVIRAHFKEHVVYLKLKDISSSKGNKYLTNNQYENVLNGVYSNKDGTTPKGYPAKLIGWLLFSGLISKSENKIIVYPPTEFSSEFGVLGAKSYLFLAATTPANTISLISKLLSVGSISVKEQSDEKLRNPVMDLVALDICKRREDLSVEFTKNIDNTLNAESILAQALLKSDTVSVLQGLLDSSTAEEREKLSVRFRDALEKPWKDSSSMRYLNGMLKYVEFLNMYNKTLQRTSR